MTEWPEIARFRRTLAAGALNRRIAKVDLVDPNRLRGSRPEDLGAALTGFHFTDPRQHGKLLALRVSCGWQLVLTPGPQGDLVLLAEDAAQPEAARLALHFADGGALVLADARGLSAIELTDDLAVTLRSQGIGPDATEMSAADFAALMARQGGVLKATLIDQARIAGLGHVYADEALFQAGLAPTRRPCDLDAAAVQRLHDTIHSILSDAVAFAGPKGEVPAHWLMARREGAATCPRCDTPLVQDMVGGQTTRACPRCQT